MTRLGLVEPARLLELLGEIVPELYRFPSLESARFRAAVETAAR